VAAAEIRAHLMDRDAIDTLVQDDHVMLQIDPFNDERRGLLQPHPHRPDLLPQGGYAWVM